MHKTLWVSNTNGEYSGNYAGEYTQVGSPAGNPGVVVNGQGVSGLPS